MPLKDFYYSHNEVAELTLPLHTEEIISSKYIK